MMKGYRGAILMISHDRTLLDRVCNQIWELDKGNIRVFDGNYSDWAAQKERERGFQEFEYQQYQKEKKRLERTTDALQRKGQTMTKAAASGCSTKAWPRFSRVMSKATKPLS